MRDARYAGIHVATLGAATTRHRDTGKSVAILTISHTYQGHMMETRKGGVVGAKRHSTMGSKVDK